MSASEIIKTANEQELSNMFCSLMEAVASRKDNTDTCEICPLSAQCRKGDNGFTTWLKDSPELNFNKFIIGL